DLNGEIVVPSSSLGEGGIKDISVDQESRGWAAFGRAQEGKNCFGNRTDSSRRNDVVGKRRAISHRSGARVKSASQRIINLDFRKIGGEIAAGQRRSRHPNIIGIKTRTRVADAFIRKQKERLVLSMVDMRDNNWTANAEPRTI